MAKRTKMGFTEAEKALMLWRKEQNSNHPNRPPRLSPPSSPISIQYSDSTSNSSSPSPSPSRTTTTTLDWRGKPIIADNIKINEMKSSKKKDDKKSKKSKKKKHKKDKIKKQNSKRHKEKSNEDEARNITAGHRTRDYRDRSRSNERRREVNNHYYKKQDRYDNNDNDDDNNSSSNRYDHYQQKERTRRSRSRSVESCDSEDSLGRSLRPGDRKKRKTNKRDISPSSFVIDNDIKHKPNNNNNNNALSSTTSSMRYGLGFQRSRHDRDVRDRRNDQRNDHSTITRYKHDDDDLTWNHDGFINSLREPSPERLVPLNYIPPKPEWKSKAGGVYIPNARPSNESETF